MQNSFEHNTTFSSFHFSSRKQDCCNFEDGNMANYIVEDDCNQSYVFLQQQHFTPPPVDFQDGSQLMQHKGSIIRNSQEYLKRNRLNNSWVWIILFLSDSIIQSIIKFKIIYYVFFLFFTSLYSFLTSNLCTLLHQPTSTIVEAMNYPRTC